MGQGVCKQGGPDFFAAYLIDQFLLLIPGFPVVEFINGPVGLRINPSSRIINCLFQLRQYVLGRKIIPAFKYL